MFSTNTRPAQLLFINDSDEDINLIQQSFSKKKYRFLSKHYTTTSDAWSYLQSTDHLPDMIFIDRNFTTSDLPGDKLIKLIRGEHSARYATCKVIVLSSSPISEQDKKTYTELNVDVIFPKPLLAENVLDMIERSDDYYFQVMREIIKTAA